MNKRFHIEVDGHDVVIVYRYTKPVFEFPSMSMACGPNVEIVSVQIWTGITRCRYIASTNQLREWEDRIIDLHSNDHVEDLPGFLRHQA